MDTSTATAPANNGVVFASAGSGKTHLLINRILRLLVDGVEPGSILAVTFTDKAAGEMRQRLYEGLQDWTNQNDEAIQTTMQDIGLTQINKQTLDRARGLYKKIIHTPYPPQLITFHSFCSQLLRQFPWEAKIPADFEILSKPELLQIKAFNNLCQRAVAQPDLMREFDELTELCNGNFSNVRNACFQFLEYSSDWLVLCQGRTSPPSLHYTQLHADRLQEIFDRLPTILKAHTEILGMAKGKKNQKSMQGMLHLLKVLPTLSASKDTTLLLEKLNSVYFTKQEQTLYKHLLDSLAPREPGTDEVEAIYNDLKSLHNKMRNELWYSLGAKLLSEYQRLKEARRLLDFDDIEWHALQLIQNQTFPYIQYRLKQKIKHILIDEFQDTNPLQWRLIKPLLEEMAAQEEDGSIFIVGDPKQSIYGFRRANSELQFEANRWIQQHLQGKTYDMNTSYRSSCEIIQSVNKVFMQSQSLGQYQEHDSKVLSPGEVIFLPFIDKKEETKQAKQATAPSQWRRILQDAPLADQDDDIAWQEATQVAEQINTLLKEKIQVHRNAQGKQECIQAQDIMILSRRKKSLPAFGRALAQRGIPYTSSHTTSDVESIELNDCIALLSFLCNPYDNLALLQVLKSPLFQLSDDQLIKLTQAKQDKQSYYDTLAICSKHSPDFKSCFEELQEWLDLTSQLPPHDLLNYIYMQKSFVQHYRAQRSSEQRDLTVHNLTAFLHHTLNFNEGRYPDLQAILNDLRSYQQESKFANNNDYLTSENSVPNGVRLMNIHQAKGLEAAVVFLVDSGYQRQLSDPYKVLVHWKSQETQPSSFILMPAKQEIDKYIQRQQDRLQERRDKEEMNVLYVALTRARQYLYISGHGTKHGGWYATLQQAIDKKPSAVTSKNDALTTVNNTNDRPYSISKVNTQVKFPANLAVVSPSQLGRKNTQARSTHKDGTMRGTVIHRMLYYLASQYTQQQVMQRMDIEFPQLHKQQDRLTSSFNEAYNLYHNNKLQDLFDDKRYQKVLNEMPLSFNFKGQQYYGIIDRFCVDAECAWIIDYKTHRIDKQAKVEQLAQVYAAQMQTYKQGIALLLPNHTVRVSLLLTANAVLFDYPATP